MLLLCFSFTMTIAIRDWEESNCHWWRCRLGLFSLKRCPQLWEWFRRIQIALHCSCHKTSSLIFHWMGRRHYFVADRLEELVDEDDSRSSSRVREHGNFRLVSQLHVAIQTLKSMSISSRCVTSVSLSLSKRLTDKLVLSQPSKMRVSISWALERDVCSAITGRPVLWIGFGFSSNFWTQFLHPIISQWNLRKRPRWLIYFFVYDFSSFHLDSLRDTTGWECIIKDDCVRPYLTELQSFPLSKLHVNPVHRLLMHFQLIMFVPCKTWCGQVKLLRILVIHVHGIHGCKENRLSFLAQMLSSRYQILNSWWRITWLHIQHDKCTRRNCQELTHCPAVEDQWIASWMTLKSSKVKNFSSWRVSPVLKSFILDSASCHFALPHFIRPILRILKSVPEDHPWVSRIRSHPHLLEVDYHDEEELSVS